MKINWINPLFYFYRKIVFIYLLLFLLFFFFCFFFLSPPSTPFSILSIYFLKFLSFFIYLLICIIMSVSVTLVVYMCVCVWSYPYTRLPAEIYISSTAIYVYSVSHGSQLLHLRDLTPFKRTIATFIRFLHTGFCEFSEPERAWTLPERYSLQLKIS